LNWLLKRIKVKSFDSNKQYASELLAILLQNSRDNRLALLSKNGIDTLLQVLAGYKRKDPPTPEEIEFMENLFDALCSSLGESELKEAFREGEGFELMLIMIREKHLARIRAIRVINYALSWTKEDKVVLQNCKYFIDILGLKTLFPLLMKKDCKKISKRYKDFNETSDDEHIVSVLASLLKTLTKPEDLPYRKRLLIKFIENDFEKLERLVSLHVQYHYKIIRSDQETTTSNEIEDLTPEELAEEAYLRQLDHGLFTLQMTDSIIAILSTDNSLDDFAPSVCGFLKLVFQKFGGDNLTQQIRFTLTDYGNTLGDQDEKARVFSLAKTFSI